MGMEEGQGGKMIPNKRLFLIWCCVVFTGAYIAPPVSAREKTDIVILKNGDRITCEVKSLSRGMLTVKTDSMGTVDIKWPDVDKITTKYLFTVQDTAGANLCRQSAGSSR
jgi:hypothetical protein